MNNAVKTTKAREYTKVDWYGYAGSEPFADGHEPLIRDLLNATAVADATGCLVTVYDEEEDDTVDYSLVIEWPNWKVAYAFLNALPMIVRESDFDGWNAI